MKDYTEKNPVFSDTIKITDTSDPGNALLLNAAPKQLLQNDLVLAAKIEKFFGGTDNESESGFAEGLDAENVIDAINKLFTQGNENKQKLVDNLIAMGIEASTEDTWGTLLDKVLDMTDTSEDTVTAAAMLEGYTAHNAAGEQITGAIPQRAGVTVDATATTQDDTYTY
ncbi:MAG: hypothetical protein K2P39_07990, partial [Lachnospiraceae bacterium]|nr:hypothetical protein [Lachnospiraceae bacterium]